MEGKVLPLSVLFLTLAMRGVHQWDYPIRAFTPSVLKG